MFVLGRKSYVNNVLAMRSSHATSDSVYLQSAVIACLIRLLHHRASRLVKLFFLRIPIKGRELWLWTLRILLGLSSLAYLPVSNFRSANAKYRLWLPVSLK